MCFARPAALPAACFVLHPLGSPFWGGLTKAKEGVRDGLVALFTASRFTKPFGRVYRRHSNDNEHQPHQNPSFVLSGSEAILVSSLSSSARPVVLANSGSCFISSFSSAFIETRNKGYFWRASLESKTCFLSCHLEMLFRAWCSD